MIAHVEILKVLDEDLDWPVPLTLAEKVKTLREKGPEIVLLTKGSADATPVFGDDTLVHVPVPKVKVADTVGVGDTFNGGFLAFLSKRGLLSRNHIKTINENDLEKTLEHGARIAAITSFWSGCRSALGVCAFVDPEVCKSVLEAQPAPRCRLLNDK